MPTPEKHFNRDYSRFDALSTETLKEILRQDALLPDGEESDLDAILSIMEVIARREEANPTQTFTPAEDAWKSFRENYLSDDCDGTSLYADPEEPTPDADVTPSPTAEKPHAKRKLRGLLRVSTAAAAMLAVLLAGSLTAYAFGYDIWGAMAQWTEDVFGLVSPKENSIYSEGDDPRDILKDYGIEEDVLPNWVPDGYQYVGIEISDSPTRKVFYISFCDIDRSEEIWLTIALLTDSSMRTYEKDLQDVMIYTNKGIDHYIMQNYEQVEVIWIAGECECSIRGYITIEDAQNMIDSIYGS